MNNHGNKKSKSLPNIIVILTDQQRWDTTGVHGNPLGLTPNFDRMAYDGTNFENMFSCQPLCAPVRSSIQTGLYPTETGVFINGLSIKEKIPDIASFFNTAGYQTGYIGKWHLGCVDPGLNGNQLSVPQGKRGSYEYWLGADLPEFMSDAYDAKLFNNEGDLIKLPGYRVDAYTDEAIKYIKEKKDIPFFLFLSYLEPHHQNTRDEYAAPKGYENLFGGNRWVPNDLSALGGSSNQHLPGYFGIVKRIDEALGRLTDTLKSLGIENNTVVFFTSDHGCHFKTRNREYKRSCHDSSIHVPAAVIGPGFSGGGKISELVSLIDIAPTLLDIAGIKIPSHMQGLSMVNLVKGNNGFGNNFNWRDEVFIQISEECVGRAVRTKRWKYSVSAPDKDGFKESNSNIYKEEFLYDLKADPYELTNLIGWKAYRSVSKVMKDRLCKNIEKIEGERPKIIESPPVSYYGNRIVGPGEEME